MSKIFVCVFQTFPLKPIDKLFIVYFILNTQLVYHHLLLIQFYLLL